ncbi:MAG: aldehyde dehydrogenase [Actinomycetota bacterium]
MSDHRLRKERFFIGGEWVSPVRRSTFPVIDPASGVAFAAVPRGAAADARAAVHAARWAFDEGPWPRLSGAERAQAIGRLVAQLNVRRAELVESAIGECGAPVRSADAQLVAPAMQAIGWYTERASRDFDVRLPDHPGPPPAGALVARDPLGVISVLCAGAEPLSSIAHTAIPAMIMGNTVVVKAPTTTPLTAFIVADAAADADLPPGVLNVLSGHARDVGKELCSNAMVDAVTLNGTMGSGRRVAELAGATAKRTIMALGSSGNAIVLAGADLDAAVRDIVQRWLRHAGQAWGAVCRVIAEEPDEIADALAHAAKGLRVGDPRDPSTEIGPLRNAHARDRAESLIADALARGAMLVAGGGRAETHAISNGAGYYLQPVVLARVDEHAHVARDEVASPIIAVVQAHSRDDAIRIANDRADGVESVVWAAARDQAFESARRVRAATVHVNGAGDNPWAPAGGYGRAGNGRFRGLAGLDAFTETKTITTP